MTGTLGVMMMSDMVEGRKSEVFMKIIFMKSFISLVNVTTYVYYCVVY